MSVTIQSMVYAKTILFVTLVGFVEMAYTLSNSLTTQKLHHSRFMTSKIVQKFQ